MPQTKELSFPNQVTKVVNELCFLLDSGNSEFEALTLGVGAGMAAEKSEPSTCSGSSFAFGGNMAMEFPQWHTLSVVQDLEFKI